MAPKEMKTYTLAEMKDEFIGKVGTQVRDEYEFELRKEVIRNNDKVSPKGASPDPRRVG